MSRSCACRHLMDALRNDPRLRLAPLGAQALWLRLVDALANLPEPGVFLLGSKPGSIREISLLVSAPEPEVATYLDYLLETGLLIRREPDGAIAVPDPTPLQRSSQARKNGSFGGRPRKGETPEQARHRRGQAEMLLSIPGGVETHENRQETEPPLAGARGLAAAKAEDAASKPRDVSQQAVEALGNELGELARMDPNGQWTWAPVADWLRMGATPELLREAFRGVIARDGYEVPRVLKYFDGAVTDALAKARAAPRPPARDATCPAFDKAFAEWRDGGCIGPVPRLSDFTGEAAHAA